jgi:general stress protein YciG
MAGTELGGRKAAATNKQRYGLQFYEQIGRKGGKISRGGGFAQNRELAVEAGRKGGKSSRRSKTTETE